MGAGQQADIEVLKGRTSNYISILETNNFLNCTNTFAKDALLSKFLSFFDQCKIILSLCSGVIYHLYNFALHLYHSKKSSQRTKQN